MRSGGSSFMIQAIAIITESVGVPVTQKRRSPCFLSLTGKVRVSEWPAPDCSSVGATTQISSENSLANFSNTMSPARSEEHTSELQSLMRITYAVFCLLIKINYIEHMHNNPDSMSI